MRPDVPALDRTFDYLVPDAMAGAVRVGTIVRVPLAGRRVRGWVVEDDVASATEPERLLGLAKVVGAGPPAEVIDLCTWAAWRWAGPVPVLLRAASPPNAVRGLAGPTLVLTPRAASAPELIAWPPAGDRRDLVAERIATSGSTLVIVADTNRLGALRKRLERDGHRMLELRGTEPDAVRTRAWADARAGRCVVVGGRVAVWAPVPDLAAIIVLDEGDEALQEERTPTWNARDVAVERARRTGATLTLVAAAPTLEAEAIAGPPERPDRSVERDGWPIVEVVDPRQEPPGTGLLTGPLAHALHQAVDRGGRAVCLLNRRGRARLLACVACNELARCERCGAFVEEAEPGTLRCARCGLERPVICLHCHATRLKGLRLGVSRVREDLAALLPRVEVVEVDASTVVLADGQVFIGTEAVLHRLPPGPPVLLCAFLDFDQELLAPRYRAAEQALGLLARAARRVGPRERGGRLLVQTRLPDHEVLEAARRADPTVVAAAERPRRQELGYPPFGSLAEVRGEEPAVRVLIDGLRAFDGISVFGPTTAPTGLQALVSAPSVVSLCDALADAAPPARAEGRLRIAVDPLRV
ncbi:MAG: primosomal protein N' family DNA-binding protein [Acidimicrobiia bacterium]